MPLVATALSLMQPGPLLRRRDSAETYAIYQSGTRDASNQLRVSRTTRSVADRNADRVYSRRRSGGDASIHAGQQCANSPFRHRRRGHARDIRALAATIASGRWTHTNARRQPQGRAARCRIESGGEKPLPAYWARIQPTRFLISAMSLVATTLCCSSVPSSILTLGALVTMSISLASASALPFHFAAIF